MKKIYIDFEMTQAREIISIGAISDDNDTFYTLIKPKNFMAMTPIIQGITHIKKSDLKDAPNAATAIWNFLSWIGTDDYELYAFGASDEIAYTETLKMNKLKGKKLVQAKGKFVDLSPLISRALKNPRTISLQDAAYELQIDFKQKHNALEDAKALKLIMEELKILPKERLIISILETIIMKEAVKYIEGRPCEYKRTFDKIGPKAMKNINPYEVLHCLRESITHDEDLKENIKNDIFNIREKEEKIHINRFLNEYLFKRERRVLLINSTDEIKDKINELNLDYIECNNIENISETVINSKCVLYNNQERNEEILDILIIYEAYRQNKEIYTYEPISLKEIPIKNAKSVFNI